MNKIPNVFTKDTTTCNVYLLRVAFTLERKLEEVEARETIKGLPLKFAPFSVSN